jgi:RNA polymerase sigma-70 factor (ECF subfamily)
MAEERPADLVRQWRAGDQQAAGELFRRYVDRLIALARGNLSARLSSRVDAEEVVQSAYRCFFAMAREGRYDLERGGDLWQMLVTITMHKLQQHVDYHSAQKRSVTREENFASAESLAAAQAELPGREPSPADAAALSDELQRALQDLTPRERQIIELRLQGCKVEEIANDLNTSERTIWRALERFKKRLEP